MTTVNIFNKLKQGTLTSRHNTTFNCPEVSYTCGRSSLKLILRKEGDDPNGADANVLNATGVQKDIAFMMDYFQATHLQVKKITNQVSNDNELKAMWKTGFRYTARGAMGAEDKLVSHQWYLKDRGSIMMVWNRL